MNPAIYVILLAELDEVDVIPLPNGRLGVCGPKEAVLCWHSLVYAHEVDIADALLDAWTVTQAAIAKARSA